ncbi:MAG: hypothetical protein KJO10_02280 [Gammaproteobacteria bacterium]|nr:hypothetical protein [Gammaproteobacteria bacterium]
MAKKITALILGIISFFLMLELGEIFGDSIAFIAVGIYYLLAQFFLSRGNTRALYKDWSLILILNAALIVTAVLILLIEPDAKYQAIVAVISIVCSIIGAGIAAWLAKYR